MDSDSNVATTCGNDITGTFWNYSTDISSVAIKDVSSDLTQSDASSTVESNTVLVNTSGDNITGSFTLSSSESGDDTITSSGTDARGTFASNEADVYSVVTSDIGNAVTGSDSASSSANSTDDVTTSGGNLETTYTQGYAEYAGIKTDEKTENIITGSYSQTMTASDTDDVSETAVASDDYTIAANDGNSTHLSATGNSITGSDAAKTTVYSDSTINEYGSNAHGSFDLTRTETGTDSQSMTANDNTGSYTSIETDDTTSTAQETGTYTGGGSATFAEEITDNATTAENGNAVTGSVTVTSTDTTTTTDSDVGTNAAGAFSVNENSSRVATSTDVANAITGASTTTITATNAYSVTETGSAYTLTESGSLTSTETDVANTVEGLYTNTTVGTDNFTLAEHGTNGLGAYTQTVTGTETVTSTETGNVATQVYGSTITGAGTFTLTDTGLGATITPGTGTYSYTLLENADARGAVFSQGETGTDRYDLLQKFNNVANTSSGSTPGNMNYSPFGQPFSDPGPGAELPIAGPQQQWGPPHIARNQDPGSAGGSQQQWGPPHIARAPDPSSEIPRADAPTQQGGIQPIIRGATTRFGPPIVFALMNSDPANMNAYLAKTGVLSDDSQYSFDSQVPASFDAPAFNSDPSGMMARYQSFSDGINDTDGSPQNVGFLGDGSGNDQPPADSPPSFDRKVNEPPAAYRGDPKTFGVKVAGGTLRYSVTRPEGDEGLYLEYEAAQGKSAENIYFFQVAYVRTFSTKDGGKEISKVYKNSELPEKLRVYKEPNNEHPHKKKWDNNWPF